VLKHLAPRPNNRTQKGNIDYNGEEGPPHQKWETVSPESSTAFCFCIQNKFNIVTFPKCGCTQICKWASECNGYFDKHCHSYSNNVCSVYGSIHACGRRNYSFNKELPTYIIYRLPHERILSYYTSNFRRGRGLSTEETEYPLVPFYEFVMSVCNRQIWDDRPGGLNANGNWPVDYEYHLGNIFKQVNTLRCSHLATIIHLDKLNDLIDNLSTIYEIPTIRKKKIMWEGIRLWDEYKKVEHFSEEALEMVMKKYAEEYTLKIDGHHPNTTVQTNKTHKK